MTSCPTCGRTLHIAPGSDVGGKYTVVRLIASGGMSHVYLARQTALSREVALKVVAIPDSHERQAVEAIKNEAFMAGRVAHPHIVSVFDHGEDEGHLFLAMEYLVGSTLAEALVQAGSLDYVRALRLMAQVGEALVAIHEAGLVHRDLKPSNILLVQSDGEHDFAKLLDFGICAPTRPSLRSLVGRDKVIGTPHYMSPEQILGRPVDARSDLYALGAITYELLVGRPLFDGPDLFEEHLKSVPTPIGIARSSVRIPRGLDDFLLRLLSKSPKQRPQTAREVVNRFRQMLPSRAGEGERPQADRIRVEDRGWFEPTPGSLRLRDPDYVDRPKESARADAALADADAGRGSVTWFVGEEGAGKTAFGARLLARAKDKGFVTALCPGASQGALMGTCRALVGALVAYEGRTVGEVRHLIQDLGLGVADPSDPTAEGVLDLLFPGPAAFDLLRSDRDAFTSYLFTSVERLLWTLAETRRLALFVDDFQLADPLSAEFLHRFCRTLDARPAPIAMFVASRPIPRAPEGERMQLHHAMSTVRDRGGVFRLSRLGDREVDTLVDSMCPAPCDAGVKRLVRRAAAGNPLFAIQMTRHLATSGALSLSGSTVALAPGADPTVPLALVELLDARIDGLRRQAPDGGQAADLVVRIALLGPWASMGTLWALTDREGRLDLRDSLDHLADRLAVEGFVTRVPWTHDDYLVFAHPVMGEAVLRETHDSTTARLHLLTAQILEKTYSDDIVRVARDLGDHYFEAGFLDRATDYLLMAGDAVMEDARRRDAREVLLKAETCLQRMGLQRDERALKVMLSLAELFWIEGEYAEAEERLAGLDRNGLVNSATAQGMHVIEMRARLAEALRQTDRAVAILEGLVKPCLDRGERHGAATAMLRLAEIRMNQGDNAAAHKLVESAEGLVKGDGDSRTVGLVHLAYGRLMRKVGSAEETFSHLDAAVATLSGPRDFAERAEAMHFRAEKMFEMNRVFETVEICRAGVALCEQTGFARGLSAHLVNLGQALVSIGREDEGCEAIVRALSIREHVGDPLGVAQCLTALAHLAIVRKEWQNALDLSIKSLALNRKHGYVLGERVALCNLGLAHEGLGQLDEAERQFNACLGTARRDKALTPTIGAAHALLADLLEAGGDGEGALRHRLNAIVVYDKLALVEQSERLRRRIGR